MQRQIHFLLYLICYFLDSHYYKISSNELCIFISEDLIYPCGEIHKCPSSIKSLLSPLMQH